MATLMPTLCLALRTESAAGRAGSTGALHLAHVSRLCLYSAGLLDDMRQFVGGQTQIGRRLACPIINMPAKGKGLGTERSV